MLVCDIMTAQVVTVRPDETLAEAVSVLRSHRIRHLLVAEEGRLVGIISDRDVKRALPSLLEGTTQEEHDRLIAATSVSRIMTREPASIAPDATVREALDAMIEHRYGALPVVDGGMIIGIVSTTDFLQLLRKMLQ